MNRFVSVQVKCASCGKAKGEANHWFVVTDHSAGLTTRSSTAIYTVSRFEPERPPETEQEFPACGESCLQKIESQILSGSL